MTQALNINIVMSSQFVKIRQLLRKVGLRLSVMEKNRLGEQVLVCLHGHMSINLDEPTWKWLEPILIELVTLRKMTPTHRRRVSQDFERDTAIVNAYDKEEQTFKTIAQTFGITPARVRQLYIRRKAQQEHNRKHVRLHVNFSGLDVARRMGIGG